MVVASIIENCVTTTMRLVADDRFVKAFSRGQPDNAAHADILGSKRTIMLVVLGLASNRGYSCLLDVFGRRHYSRLSGSI
jgi:hypothetical protein